MTRRSFLVGLGLFVLLACAAGSTLVLLVRHEPRPYLQAELPPGADRKRLSEDFLREFFAVCNSVGGEGGWSGHFTQEQINGYLEEDFLAQSRGLLPDGISEPRVVIEPDRLRLAFRYGSGFWSTVISIDLNIWLPRNEPNVVALRLEGFHAGALPISAQSLLERISETARQNGVDVNWYRHQGHPVALLRFQADKARSTLQLRGVQLSRGEITILGGSAEAAPEEPSPARTTRLDLPEHLLPPGGN
jgi:hypothetical protein